MSKHYGLTDLKWIDEELYFRGKDTQLRIIPDGQFFRVAWPDGVQSADFYNFTRARLAAKQYVLDHIGEFPSNRGRKPSGAILGVLNAVGGT